MSRRIRLRDVDVGQVVMTRGRYAGSSILEIPDSYLLYAITHWDWDDPYQVTLARTVRRAIWRHLFRGRLDDR